MSENFQYGDIIIIALIAVFILLRLRSVLGQNMGQDGNNNSDFFAPKPDEGSKRPDTIIQLVGKTIKPNAAQNEENTVNLDDDNYAKNSEGNPVFADLIELKKADSSFNASHFLEGAKLAFEMVFDAFVKADKDTLSMLLSKDLCEHFVASTEERKKAETYTETTLLSVRPVDILSVNLDKNIVRLTVSFESEQVALEKNQKGEIISGNPKDVSHVVDEWVFERDINSKNPNWKIIET